MNNKGSDQTAQADLCLCCSLLPKTGFLMMWLIDFYSFSDTDLISNIVLVEAQKNSQNDMYAH